MTDGTFKIRPLSGTPSKQLGITNDYPLPAHQLYTIIFSYLWFFSPEIPSNMRDVGLSDIDHEGQETAPNNGA
jgi:hypothetical protein